MQDNPTPLPFRGLHVLEVAHEAVRELRPIVAKIRRADRDLGEQVGRALSSVALNTAEVSEGYSSAAAALRSARGMDPIPVGSSFAYDPPWAPARDIAFVHDWGLLVSLPLLAVPVWLLARAAYARYKERERIALTLAGAALHEGPVIVAVTREGAEVVRTRDGSYLRIDEAPLPLAHGEQGEVLGTFVRDERIDGTDYRTGGRPSAGRLLPVHGRYEVVPPSAAPSVADTAGRGFLVAYFGAMTALAAVARIMECCESRRIVSAVWLALAMPMVGFALIVVPVLLAPAGRRLGSRWRDLKS
jgi:hypothetical protein